MHVMTKFERFHRWLLPVLSVAFAAAATAPPATARAHHTVSLVLRDTIVQRSLSSKGLVNTTAGAFTGRPFGDGAIVQRGYGRRRRRRAARPHARRSRSSPSAARSAVRAARRALPSRTAQYL
jgi:hypothetical protein